MPLLMQANEAALPGWTDLLTWASTYGLALVISILFILGCVSGMRWVQNEVWPRVVGFLDGLLRRIDKLDEHAAHASSQLDTLSQDVRVNTDEMRRGFEDLKWKGQERRDGPRAHAPTGGGK